LYFASAIDL